MMSPWKQTKIIIISMVLILTGIVFINRFGGNSQVGGESITQPINNLANSVMPSKPDTPIIDDLTKLLNDELSSEAKDMVDLKFKVAIGVAIGEGAEPKPNGIQIIDSESGTAFFNGRRIAAAIVLYKIDGVNRIEARIQG